MIIVKTVLTLCIVAVFSIILVQRVSNNKFTVGGYGIYTVISPSMRPEYDVFDMIIAKNVDDPLTLKKGDVVVYKGEKDDFKDKIVTHRIEKVYTGTNPRKFLTKGDANDYPDPEITANQIMGKVEKKTVILSFLSHIVNNIYGFYFIVFVPIVVMVFLEVMESINERKELKKLAKTEEEKEEKQEE
jgi:signal peptidase